MADRAELFGRRIIDLATAKRWIEDLAELGLMFHFEDDPSDVVNADTGAFVNEQEAGLLRLRVAELYALEWPKGIDCPIGYALDVIEAGWRDR